MAFITPYGRENTTFIALLSCVGIAASVVVARWYNELLLKQRTEKGATEKNAKLAQPGDKNWIPRPYSNRRTYFYIGVLLVLIFSKYVYMASMSSYFTFFMIEKFSLSAQYSQYSLFIFIFSTALGTILGGPIGDKIGRKYVIWASILGATPFSLLLPHMGLAWTLICSFGAGFMLSSAFPAIVIMAQELLPNRLGMISGLFFGFAFGIAGISAAIWGVYADAHSVQAVFNLAAFLPLLGVVAVFLPRR